MHCLDTIGSVMDTKTKKIIEQYYKRGPQERHVLSGSTKVFSRDVDRRGIVTYHQVKTLSRR